MDVEFVIVSGFAEFAYAQEALRYGALDYFLKPIDIEMADPLIEKLALHFSKKKSMRNNLMLEALISTDKRELQHLTPFFDHTSDYYYRVLIMYSNSEKRIIMTDRFLIVNIHWKLNLDQERHYIFSKVKKELIWINLILQFSMVPI